jgi:hypothetical protein
MKTPGFSWVDEEEDEVAEILDELDEGAVEWDGSDEDAETTLFQYKGPKKKMPKAAAGAAAPVQVQLATRIDAQVFKIMKVHVVQSDMSVMEFVHNALVHELERAGAIKGSKKKGA